MRLGIFGGSFDPIHVGHLVVACDARDEAGLDRVLVLPTAHPPHKPDRCLASIEDRLEMARLATHGVPGLEVCEVEAKVGPSYTVDTLRWAANAFDDPELFLILGEDSLAELHTWRAPEDIVRMATLLVYGRSGVEPGRVRFPSRRLRGETIDVSSSLVRARLARGASIRFWVPDAVHGYIERHGLYRSPSPC